MSSAKEYLGKLQPNVHVNIIGGGISGLVTGYFLDKANIPFTLYEKENRVGGKIQSVTNENGVFEQAANAIYSSDLVYEIINDLNLTPIQSNKPLKKIVWRNSSPTSPPISKKELFLRITKLFKHTPDQTRVDLTVEEFFKPFLGAVLTKEVLAPALTGIYAEDVSNLHHRSIFPISTKKSERYISYFLRLKKSRLKPKVPATSLSFEGGLSELVSALRDRLADNIKLNNDLSTLDLTNTIIATDATEAARIVSSKFPKLANQLRKVEYSALSLTHCFTNFKVPYLENAFGMVFTPNHKERKLIGILSNNQIFSKKTTSSDIQSYSFIIQGEKLASTNLEKDLNHINASQIIQQSLSHQTFSWTRAIPIYNYQRFKAIEESRSIMKEMEAGLVIHGNYIHGVSLRDIIKNANTLVNNLTKITS